MSLRGLKARRRAEAGLLPVEGMALTRPVRTEIVGELVHAHDLKRATERAGIVHEVGDVAAMIYAQDQQSLDRRASEQVLEESEMETFRITRHGLSNGFHATRILGGYFEFCFGEAAQACRLRFERRSGRPTLPCIHLHIDIPNPLRARSFFISPQTPP